MKPTTLKERYNTNTSEAILEEDNFDKEQDGMSDEDLKIESLKIATNICKLMNDVLPEDIIEVAEKVAQFIKNGGELSVTSDDTTDTEEDFEDDGTTEDVSDDTETSDFEEDFSTEDDTETSEENDTESEETEEDFKV